jgi:hypothetical protein
VLGFDFAALIAMLDIAHLRSLDIGIVDPSLLLMVTRLIKVLYKLLENICLLYFLIFHDLNDLGMYSLSSSLR